MKEKHIRVSILLDCLSSGIGRQMINHWNLIKTSAIKSKEKLIFWSTGTIDRLFDRRWMKKCPKNVKPIKAVKFFLLQNAYFYSLVPFNGRDKHEYKNHLIILKTDKTSVANEANVWHFYRHQTDSGMSRLQPKSLFKKKSWTNLSRSCDERKKLIFCSELHNIVIKIRFNGFAIYILRILTLAFVYQSPCMRRYTFCNRHRGSCRLSANISFNNKLNEWDENENHNHKSFGH